MEMPSHCLHPGIVCVSLIIHVSLVNLEAGIYIGNLKEVYVFLQAENMLGAKATVYSKRFTEGAVLTKQSKNACKNYKQKTKDKFSQISGRPRMAYHVIKYNFIRSMRTITHRLTVVPQEYQFLSNSEYSSLKNLD